VSEAEMLDERCGDHCLLDCKTRTFATVVEHESTANSSRNELKLVVQSFTSPLFEEKLAMTFDNFISQFGGILGLYISISFAALVHLPVFVIRQLVRRFRRSARAANFEDPAVEISGIEAGQQKLNENFVDVLMRRFDCIDKRFQEMERRFGEFEKVERSRDRV